MKVPSASAFDVLSKEELEDKAPDATSSKKLPLQINSQIMLYDVSNTAHRARTRIIGAVEHDCIMIERPEFSISDRLSAVVDSDYTCSYLHEGYLYRFRTKQKKELSKKIVCIEYPDKFETIQLRKHRRIKVSVEAKFEIASMDQPVRGSVKDISEGGCMLVLPAIVHIPKGALAAITFKLPDDQLVEKVQCTVRNIQQVYMRQYTAIGMSFNGPGEELEKVRAFCDFCKKFRV